MDEVKKEQLLQFLDGVIKQDANDTQEVFHNYLAVMMKEKIANITASKKQSADPQE